MSAQYEELLEVKSVTDYDHGTYSIDEIGYSVYGALEEYLKRTGSEGRDKIIVTLGLLQSLVFKAYEETLKMDERACEARKP